jgi:hypothetical protein
MPVRFKRNKKNTAYIVATLVTMVIFLPFQNHAWSLYAGACAGYSVLVFGLRRIRIGSGAVAMGNAKPASEILLTHLSFLVIVVGWVWLCVVLKPHLPYFLRTEDTSRPYFGLAFLGILGLLGIEAIEQRWLEPNAEADAFAPENNSSQRSLAERK